MKEETNRTVKDPSSESTQDEVESEEQDQEKPAHRWLRNLKLSQPGKSVRPLSQRATQDRVKPLFLGILGVAVVIVVLLGLFSTPISVKRNHPGVERRTPNLGRPQTADPTTAEAQAPQRSVTPLLRAEVRSERGEEAGWVTESDLATQNPHKGGTDGFRAPSGVPSVFPVQPSKPTSRPMSLDQIEFSHSRSGKLESLSEVKARIAGFEARLDRNPREEIERRKSLELPSLVFVTSGGPATNAPTSLPVKIADGREDGPLLGLPAGTRLLARLQSTITTAVAAPVVAMVEYNYEQDGTIIVPAASKVFGKIEQASHSGQVGVAFESIETPNHDTWKVEAVAQALDFGPLKGRVEGKKNLARFVTRAATGVGVVAAQVVGLRGGLNGPINNSVLVRDRLATNVAQAGEQQLQQMAINSNLIITVPANTRLYVVMRKAVRGTPRNSDQATSGGNRLVTSAQALTHAELEELRTLRHEFQRWMQLAAGKTNEDRAITRVP
jgi:Bacterial conjugation TrbI-like protein